jgi:uncharacterized protein with GYD domain
MHRESDRTVDVVRLGRGALVRQSRHRWRSAMAYYMVQASYTAQALAALVKSPQDREQGFRALVGKLGGRVEAFFWAQGEYDLVVIVEVPDAETANALALAAVAPGHAKTYKTTPLFTNEETMRAMQKAGEVTYQALR